MNVETQWAAKVADTSQQKRLPGKEGSEEREHLLNWEWYDPPAERLPVEFCLETTLHGMKYLGQQKRHVCERLFWLGALVTSVVSATLLIWTMWRDYINMPIVTVLNPTEVTLSEIPFPSVTICNVNNIQKVEYKKILGSVGSILAKRREKPLTDTSYLQTLAKFVAMNHICDSTQAFLERFVKNSSLDEYYDEIQEYMKHIDWTVGLIRARGTLRKVSQPCHEMVLHCTWHGEVKNCSKLFKPIETDYGICCTFNSVPVSKLLKNGNQRSDSSDDVGDWTAEGLDYETLIFTNDTMNRKYPYRQRSAGRTSGLSFLVTPDLSEYYCPNTDSEGFMLDINVPLDFPRMARHGTAVPTGAEIFLGVTPEITISDPLLKRFKPERRKCYYGNEYKLPHYTMYTIANCKSECIARNMLEVCSCVLYHMPRDQNHTLCKSAKYECAADVIKNISAVGLSSICTECLPTCNEIEYHEEGSHLRLQRGRIKKFFGDQNETLRSRDVSIVHVYFKDDSVYPRMRKEVMTLTQLISNAGGLLGLCLGFSALSLLEIFYYGTMRICCRSYRQKVIRGLNEKSANTERENDGDARRHARNDDNDERSAYVFRISKKSNLDYRFEDSIEAQIRRAFLSGLQTGVRRVKK